MTGRKFRSLSDLNLARSRWSAFCPITISLGRFKLQTDGQQSMIFSFGNARTECYDLPASFENPTVVISISKKDTNFKRGAWTTKSSVISNRAFDSGLKGTSRDLAGLIGVHVEMILAMTLPNLATLLPLWGVPISLMSIV